MRARPACKWKIGARGPSRPSADRAIRSKSSAARPYSPLSKLKFASCKTGGTFWESVLRIVRRNMRRITIFLKEEQHQFLPPNLFRVDHRLARFFVQRAKILCGRPYGRWDGVYWVQPDRSATESHKPGQKQNCSV